MPTRLDQLGQTVATPGALEALREAEASASDLLRRHMTLDRGDLDLQDHRANLDALRTGAWVFSSYRLPGGEKVWVITEAVGDDGRRGSTCILTPDEY